MKPLEWCRRNMINAGINPLEPAKRVARALVRMIYKQLMSLTESYDGMAQKNAQMGDLGSHAGSGRARGKDSNPGNMVLPAHADDTT